VPDDELKKLSDVAKLSEDYQKLVLVFQTNQVAAQLTQLQMQQQQMAMQGMMGGGGMPPGSNPGAPPAQPQMPGVNAPSEANPKGVPFQNAASGPQGFMAGVQGQPGLMGG
jgi:hypothetical protein